MIHPTHLILRLSTLLLAVKQAASQLDLHRTHKIINLAMHMTLCSPSNAGLGNIYAVRQRYPCTPDLWILGPGGTDGLYTVKNFGSDLFIGVNETSGHLVTTRNITPFKISSDTYGNDITIKIPYKDLVWTVGASKISQSDILLQPEIGNRTQLWNLLPTQEERGLVVTSRDNETFAALDQATWAQFQNADFRLIIIGLIAHFKISIPTSRIRGSGFAPGIGLSFMAGAGVISFNDAGVFLSGPVEFILANAGLGLGGMTAAFYVEGTIPIATMSFKGGGIGLSSVAGRLTWQRY
jgi:hypothetical protein